MSQGEKEAFLRALKIQSRYKTSKKNRWYTAGFLLIFAFVVFSISSEEVNQNTVFSYFTFAQGLVLLPLYYLVQKKGMDQMLQVAFVTYIVIWVIEMCTVGFPNDLLAAYNTIRIEGSGSKPRITFLYREEHANREVIRIFPYFYSAIKLLFAILIFQTVRNVYRFHRLDPKLRSEIL